MGAAAIEREKLLALHYRTQPLTTGHSLYTLHGCMLLRKPCHSQVSLFYCLSCRWERAFFVCSLVQVLPERGAFSDQVKIMQRSLATRGLLYDSYMSKLTR